MLRSSASRFPTSRNDAEHPVLDGAPDGFGSGVVLSRDPFERPVAEGSGEAPGIGPMNRDLSRYLVMIESADMRPAASGQKASRETCVALQKNLAIWLKLNDENIPAVNKQLETFHLASLPLARPKPALTCQ